jgi:hypothetical protein
MTQFNNYINCKFVTSLFISLSCNVHTESFVRNSNTRENFTKFFNSCQRRIYLQFYEKEFGQKDHKEP